MNLKSTSLTTHRWANQFASMLIIRVEKLNSNSLVAKLRNCKMLKMFSQLSWISLNSVSQHSLSLPKKLSQRHDMDVACTGIIIPHIRRSLFEPMTRSVILGSLIPGFELVVGSFAWISSNIIVTRFIWNIFTFLFTDCFHTGFFKFTITVSQITLSFNTGRTNTFWKYIVKKHTGQCG